MCEINEMCEIYDPIQSATLSMFHCPVGVWVFEQHAITVTSIVSSPNVEQFQGILKNYFITLEILDMLIRRSCEKHRTEWFLYCSEFKRIN